MRGSRTAAVDLHWIPLGAGDAPSASTGGSSRPSKRRASIGSEAALYHAVLVVELTGDRYAIELAPSPDADGAGRGALVRALSGAVTSAGCACFATRSAAGMVGAFRISARRLAGRGGSLANVRVGCALKHEQARLHADPTVLAARIITLRERDSCWPPGLLDARRRGTGPSALLGPREEPTGEQGSGGEHRSLAVQRRPGVEANLVGDRGLEPVRFGRALISGAEARAAPQPRAAVVGVERSPR